MCGIAGIVNLREPAPINIDGLKRMSAVMQHRGPDESGIYVDDWAGLVNNRLSIIDLEGGSQPIHNEDKSMWIVYNGEVFNYPELREYLVKKGHSFYTNTDTEVVLHMYEEKGPECLDEFNGQFAFAIWDKNNRELFLARDRVGIHPLHYTVYNDTLLFASEIKSVFAYDSSIPREIDPLAMDQIFTFWTTLPSRTVFEDIHELPAGYYARVKQGDVRLTQYWDIPHCPDEEKVDWYPGRIARNIRELLFNAIRVRLRADVPVGAYLSGGLDSSGITSMITRYFNNDVKTFGIRFEDRDYDEGSQQWQMAEYLGVDHHELKVSNGQIAEALSDYIWHAEKPVLRKAPIPLYLLSEFVRQNDRKVVLTGEGADEVFGGYNIFREAKVRRFWAKQPDSQFRPLLLKKLYPYIFKNTSSHRMLALFFGRGLTDVENPLYSHQLRWSNSGRNKSYFSDKLKDAIGEYDPMEELQKHLPAGFHQWDYFEKAQYLEMKIFMGNYLLSSQGDRAAMAHSVEIRVPYLDHHVIEFMARVPSEWKIRGLDEKYLLKKAYKNILPDQILRRNKQPYRAPIEWDIGSHDNFNNISEFLSAGIFDMEKSGKLLTKVQNSDIHSETDNMALAGMITSSVLADNLISKNSLPGVLPEMNKLIDARAEVTQEFV